MKRFLPLLAFTFLALGLVALPARAQHTMNHGEHPGKMHEETTDVLHPEVIDGVQVVEIEVGKMGYSADRIALEAGVPARLVFTRTQEGGCTFQVQIPDFGVEPTDLPVGEPVAIEFTPEEAGSYTFACGMGMVKGGLLVKS